MSCFLGVYFYIGYIITVTDYELHCWVLKVQCCVALKNPGVVFCQIHLST